MSTFNLYSWDHMSHITSIYVTLTTVSPNTAKNCISKWSSFHVKTRTSNFIFERILFQTVWHTVLLFKDANGFVQQISLDIDIVLKNLHNLNEEFTQANLNYNCIFWRLKDATGNLLNNSEGGPISSRGEGKYDFFLASLHDRDTYSFTRFLNR